jgi:serine O-acetyltransferase
METVRRIRRDYEVHGGDLNSGFITLFIHRYGNWASSLPAPARWIAKRVYAGMFLGIQCTVVNSVYREVKFGEDPHLIHAHGIFIHPDVKIGDRVGIMHRVTLGTTHGREGVPTIGNDVFIASGAMVCGPVKIGDGAIIAANTVVVTDVPAGATAIGVPARIMRPTNGAEDRATTSKAVS